MTFSHHQWAEDAKQPTALCIAYLPLPWFCPGFCFLRACAVFMYTTVSFCAVQYLVDITVDKDIIRKL